MTALHEQATRNTILGGLFFVHLLMQLKLPLAAAHQADSLQHLINFQNQHRIYCNFPVPILAYPLSRTTPIAAD